MVHSNDWLVLMNDISFFRELQIIIETLKRTHAPVVTSQPLSGHLSMTSQDIASAIGGGGPKPPPGNTIR